MNRFIEKIISGLIEQLTGGQFDHVWLMVPYHDRRLAYFLCCHGWMNGFVCICVCRVSHTTTIHCLSQTKAGCISAGLRDEPKTRRHHTLYHKLEQHKCQQILCWSSLLVDVSHIFICLMAHTLFFRPLFFFVFALPSAQCESLCVWLAHKQTRREYCRIYSVWSEGYRDQILCKTKWS